MIIGIDGNEANVQRKVGIGEYAFALLDQFKKMQTASTGQVQKKFRIYLKNPPNKDMPEESTDWQYRIVKPAKLWTQIGLPFDLFLHNPKPDVFFTPSHYAPRFSPVAAVISIMDVSYLRFPDLFKSSDLYQLQQWTAYSVKKAAKIFTISQTSKNDIIKFYKVEPEKVIVTYPGIKLEGKNMNQAVKRDELKKQFGISSSYILFVGTLQPRKNIIRLIEAFSIVHKQENDLELVIVGKKGWLYEDILQAPQKYAVASSVKFLEFVDDKELEELYKDAVCFVLPSLYEGFGLPVVEAMKYGCPVITSDVSSLPEAGGDAALYVDPTDTNDIAEKIKQVVHDKKLRNTMIEKGYKHIKKFSWEKTAQETLDVLIATAKGEK